MNMMKRLVYLAPLLVVGCVHQHGPDAWIPAVNPLPPERIVAMKRSGMADGAIWREVELQGVLRKANSDDLVALKQAGAGDGLIGAVTTAPVRMPEPARPVYYPHPPGYHEVDAFNAAAATFVTIAGFALLYGAAWACWD